MRCPHCQSEHHFVNDSRKIHNGVWRSRTCKECNKKFSTYESVSAGTKKSSRRNVPILSTVYERLAVVNRGTGAEIAVITNGDTPVSTVANHIAVKLVAKSTYKRTDTY